MKKNEIKIKIVLIGTKSGKIGLISRYVHEKYSEELNIFGMDYEEKIINIEGKKVNLEIIDTLNQERFHVVPSNYYSQADGIMFAFDITDKNSFEFAKKCLKDANFENKKIKKILVGNNIELKYSRIVSKENIEIFAQNNKYRR